MSHNVNSPPVPNGHLNGVSKFEAFKKSLQTSGKLLFKKEQTDDERTIEAAWLKALVRDGVISRPIHIRYAIIKGDLNLQYVTFKGSVSITESTFLGKVNLSFTKFNCGIKLKASRFEQKVDFRAAHSIGDFRLPLTRFNQHACFEDIYAAEVFSAEGALFKRAHFMRAHFAKSALFSGALVADGKLVRTRFQDEADFSDACFKGPAYFKGVCFEKKATFDRIRIESSGFFDCDGLGDRQISHKLHHLTEIEIQRKSHELLLPEYRGKVSFIGARIDNSLTFGGVHFKDKADFRRIQIAGTAIFDPYTITNETDEPPQVFVPVLFDGDADFWNADIKGAAQFNAVHFSGEANFKQARVGRGAFFRAIEHNKRLYRTVFGGEAVFLNADIDGSLVCDGARFIGDATFMGIRIAGVADFLPVIYGEQLCPVLFNSNATFLDAYIKSGLNFDGACFNIDVSFERVITDGSAFFRVAKYEDFISADKNLPEPAVQETELPVSERERLGKLIPTEFFGKVRFVGARIKANAEFDGAQFHKEALFEHVEVGGDVYFRPWEVGATPAHFFNKANFIGADIKGMAEFSGTVFTLSADFTGMVVGGNAYFDSQHHYDEKDTLDYWHPKRKISAVQFYDGVQFNGAIFRNEVDFRGAQFGNQYAKLERKVDFTGVRSEGPVYFYGAKFWIDVLFREARFTSLFFDRPDLTRRGWIKMVIDKINSHVPAEEKKSQFVRGVDLGGCSYERIGVKLEHLRHSMKPVRGNHDEPYEEYNRQPYTHLIKVLRAVGDDRRADEVYLWQRHLERGNIWKRAKTYMKGWRLWKATRGFTNYGFDWLFWHLGKYGVQPERLFFISLFLIIIGARIFSLPYAVKIKSTERDAPRGVIAMVKPAEGFQQIEMKESPGEKNDLDWPDAMRVSLSQFIPIVDIPSGAKWKPNENGYFEFLSLHIPYDLYGSVHRLLGAIFVPLIIAALAAALYRRLQKDL